MANEILILGLSKLGKYLAQEFVLSGCDVYAVDISSEKLAECNKMNFPLGKGDVTDAEFVETLCPESADACFVTLGNCYKESLECVDILKSFMSKRVIAQAIDSNHAKFLELAGAHKTLLPEYAMAKAVSIAYTNTDILDYNTMYESGSAHKVYVPDDWINRSIAQIGIRKKYNVNVIGVFKDNVFTPIYDPLYKFKNGEYAVVVGEYKNIF